MFVYMVESNEGKCLRLFSTMDKAEKWIEKKDKELGFHTFYNIKMVAVY